MENNDWSTPQNIFDELDKEFRFDIDACASFWNTKCSDYYDISDDALLIDWVPGKTYWMNPPYGREIGKWIEKAYIESRRGSTIVCLIPARTETKWFHSYCLESEIRFVKGRIHFSDRYGKTGRPRFSSIIVIMRPEPIRYLNRTFIQNPQNKTN
jgi:phage N-6-adenine-methyltransferase